VVKAKDRIEVNYEQLGEALWGFTTMDSENRLVGFDVMGLLSEMNEDQKSKLRSEITILEMFAVTYACRQEVGDAKVIQCVLDSYHDSCYESMEYDGATQEQIESFENLLQKRYQGYYNARPKDIEAHKRGSIPWYVGKTATQYVFGSLKKVVWLDKAYMFQVIFGTTVKTARDLIGKYKIITTKEKEGPNSDKGRKIIMSEKISLSEKQIDTLCYFLCNFSMSLHLLLLEEHKDKDVDSSAWTEQYEDILGHPITQWPLERKQEQEQLVHALGEDKAQRVLEEILYFLIFHIVNNCCGPYVSKRELIRLLDRFYKVAFTEWLPISPDRDSYNKYAGARNALEKFSIDLAIILDENFITGAKMAIPASIVARDMKSVIDKFFKEPHRFGLD